MQLNSHCIEYEFYEGPLIKNWIPFYQKKPDDFKLAIYT